MPIEIKVPSVGESITSGVLGVWSKPDGAYVKAGEPIFEIETDKVTSEIVAESNGRLKHLVKAGDTVQIGQVVASIDDKAPAPVEAAVPAPAEPKKEKKGEGNGAKAPGEGGKPSRMEAAAPVAAARGKSAHDLSPAVRYQTEEKGIDPASIPGTGKDGRVLKSDVLVASERSSADKGASPTASPLPPSAGGERTSRKKMSQLRQKIAARLLAAQQETAHLTTFNEVDLSNVIALRTKFQERFVKKHEVKLGFMSFFVKAVVHALHVVPTVNSRIDGDEVIQNNFYDIGCAISTEKGLVVPVIRDADQLSFAGVEKAIAAYAKKARDGKITLPDMEGGVFTITNGGIFGSLMSTPILNPPQCGILGMHAIQERPVAIAGRVEIRPMMYLALTYDHRLVDGREAVTFLATIKEVVENPAAVLLEV
ncbi:MAG TPA: 2-oxoglutarate dehydrogenase complex dihydrolipoyllysine-residue succinyltransferase [Candidatus Methylacidiphilales bacterium]|jgi:2-oxoglutarate dehydrogenase E2 component (dihydrolipoamide succinyltransferase)|nr:2-oxoglutarate dehydrogenase complex dihydrolipoyllysine-residue succinyltransferase [Candidatus Methylacidiphilales bacterium]